VVEAKVCNTPKSEVAVALPAASITACPNGSDDEEKQALVGNNDWLQPAPSLMSTWTVELNEKESAQSDCGYEMKETAKTPRNSMSRRIGRQGSGDRCAILTSKFELQYVRCLEYPHWALGVSSPKSGIFAGMHQEFLKGMVRSTKEINSPWRVVEVFERMRFT
jgi:hypothetical protein